jgi:hypothetical protein
MEKKEYRNSKDENMLVDFESVYRHRQGFFAQVLK